MRTRHPSQRPVGGALVLAAAGIVTGTLFAPASAAAPTNPRAPVSAFAGPLQTERTFDRLIIRFKEPAITSDGAVDTAAVRDKVAGLDSGGGLKPDRASAVRLRYVKSVTPETHVALTDRALSRGELFALSKQLERAPGVAHVEIDEPVFPHMVPNDPLFASMQWHFKAPGTLNEGGMNLPGAWDVATGSGVVVAVIDIGYRPHEDLKANLLPGYDFISDLSKANDGDLLDADASDPGDWVTATEAGSGAYVGCAAAESSWHGTHLAGTIAAVTNNKVGGAGVAYNAKILPVRALGKCGGHQSDVVAGIRWAAGLSVPDTPINRNPAKVLNLSLGTSGLCSQAFQEAVDAARAAGSIIVASTGNDGQNLVSQPANCRGVIAVTAHTQRGDRALYANTGPGTTLSAPGGGKGVNGLDGDGAGVVSTVDTGLTTPTGSGYASFQGTSMAVPHVAGVAALLVNLQPTFSADAIRSILSNSARPHPANSACAAVGDCGAGLLDAQQAVARASTSAPVVVTSINPDGIAPTRSTIQLTATAWPGLGGNAALQYAWIQTAGPAVALSNSGSASPSFVATETGANYAFQVTVTDGDGLKAADQATVTTNTAPTLKPIEAKTVAAGDNLNFTIQALDPENQPVALLAIGLPAGASLDPASGVFTWNDAGPVGTHSFEVIASDGIFSSAPQTVAVTVAPASGGGAVGWIDGLILLSLALVSLAIRRRQNVPG